MHHIHTLELGTMDNFIHIITDTDSRQAMVVDPAWDADAILQAVAEQHCELVGILLTHSHEDHISAVQPLLDKKPLPVYISREEFRIGLARIKKPTFVTDGDTITLGNTQIEVIATPGHTLGSVCYCVNQQDIIVGDTLFIDGCGRCNFFESRVESMFDSMQRLKQLPDHVVIHAGHHYGQQKTDTIGRQKQTNPYLLINDREFFIRFRMTLQADYRSIPFAPSSAAEMQSIFERHQADTA